MTKDITMKSRIALLALATMLAGCKTGADDIHTGLSATHVPVVTQATYTYDAMAPGGSLNSTEMQRLDDWFNSLNVSYGDAVYVDGPAGAARAQVGEVAGQYGILVSDGAPVTAGVVSPDAVRVVVRRAEAYVPGCPDWSGVSEPNYKNENMPNFGCGVSGALAMQVANAEDLVHGRAGSSAEDGATASKAINLYRSWPLTGVIEGQQRRPMKKTETFTRER